MKLLVFDPSREFASRQGDRLSSLGFVPTRAISQAELLSLGKSALAEAILIDLPALNSSVIESVRALRRSGITLPVMVIAGESDWHDRVDAFDAGVDDFVHKPVRSEEIASRLRAMIRRAGGNSTDRIVDGTLELDLKLQCGWLAGQCLDLTRSEFRLLRLFMLAPDRTISKTDIRERLQKRPGEASGNAVEVQITRLRRKIGRDRIRTLRDQGYRFVSSDVAGDVPEDAAEPDSRVCLGIGRNVRSEAASQSSDEFPSRVRNSFSASDTGQ